MLPLITRPTLTSATDIPSFCLCIGQLQKKSTATWKNLSYARLYLDHCSLIDKCDCIMCEFGSKHSVSWLLHIYTGKWPHTDSRFSRIVLNKTAGVSGSWDHSELLRLISTFSWIPNVWLNFRFELIVSKTFYMRSSDGTEQCFCNINHLVRLNNAHSNADHPCVRNTDSRRVTDLLSGRLFFTLYIKSF